MHNQIGLRSSRYEGSFNERQEVNTSKKTEQNEATYPVTVGNYKNIINMQVMLSLIRGAPWPVVSLLRGWVLYIAAVWSFGK